MPKNEDSNILGHVLGLDLPAVMENEERTDRFSEDGFQLHNNSEPHHVYYVQHRKPEPGEEGQGGLCLLKFGLADYCNTKCGPQRPGV